MTHALDVNVRDLAVRFGQDVRSIEADVQTFKTATSADVATIKTATPVSLTITGTANALIGAPPAGFTPGFGSTVSFVVQSTNTAAAPTMTIGGVTRTVQMPTGGAVPARGLRAGNVILARVMSATALRIIGQTEYVGTLPANTDLGTLYTPGTHVLAGTAVLDKPEGSGTFALITVREFGNYVIQTWHVLGNPASGWAREILTTTGAKSAWSPLKVDASAAVTKFTGRTVVSLGDSVSEGLGSTDGLGFIPPLSAALGTSVVRGGIGGTCLSEFGGPNFVPFSAPRMADAIATGDWTAMQTAAQNVFTSLGDDNRPQVNALAALNWTQELFVLFAFGTNDWTSTLTALGTPGTIDKATIRGSVNYVIDRILTARPNLRIGFLTPIWRGRFAGTAVDSDTHANAQGFTLAQIAAAIREEAERNHIPVLDNYTRSGLNKYVRLSHYADETHPNDTGYAAMARSISGWALAELS